MMKDTFLDYQKVFHGPIGTFASDGRPWREEDGNTVHTVPVILLRGRGIFGGPTMRLSKPWKQPFLQPSPKGIYISSRGPISAFAK